MKIDPALIPAVVAQTCLEGRDHDLTAGQIQWFVEHVALQIRLMRPGSTATLTRDQAYMWVNHWLDAYILDPDIYKERHPTIVSDDEVFDQIFNKAFERRDYADETFGIGYWLKLKKGNTTPTKGKQT